jgi:hypothetical protein
MANVLSKGSNNWDLPHLGFRAKGREVMEDDKGYQLREGSAPYKALSGAENDDIGLENTYLWEIKI